MGVPGATHGAGRGRICPFLSSLQELPGWGRSRSLESLMASPLPIPMVRKAGAERHIPWAEQWETGWGRKEESLPCHPPAPGPGSLALSPGSGSKHCKDPLPEGGSQMDCLPKLIICPMVECGVQWPAHTPAPQQHVGSLPSYLPTQPEADSQ